MTSVSVIIPTWNREVTIKRAVLSALNQTYPVSEIFVCDDGSTDNSREIIEGIGNNKVKWISGPRAGLPAVPRNRGIKASTGEWLAFLDSDDEWLPFKIEKQIKAAELLKTEAVCGNAFRITPNNNAAKPYLDYTGERITFENLVGSNYVICSSCLIKRTVVNNLGGFPESPEFKAIEDYALWLKVATLADFAFVKEPIVNYYDDPKQSIRDNTVTELQQREKIFASLSKWMENNPGTKPFMLSAVKQEQKRISKMMNPGLLYRLFNKTKGA
jgi:glycosyltransferase involved in cell wall biosynthesis